MIPLFIAPEHANHIQHGEVVGLHLSHTTEESSYYIAKLLMKCVYWFLDILGLEHHPTLFIILYATLVFLIAWGIGIVVKWILITILNKIGPHVKNNFYQYLVSHHFFTKLCRIVPPLLFLIFIQFTLNDRQSLAAWLSRFTWVYIVVVFSSTFATLADVIWDNVNDRANKKKLPLNGVVQLIKLLIWIVALIVIFGILLDKSPASMLAGLGAFSAVLMLVFKDNILGVVAGVQLAQNDSLHEGDWIAPNGSDANGTVVGVSLTAIKIQNWDKTISTIPPYNLISQGFRNYRSMQLSNTRRIQRSYMIDADSIVAATDEMLAEFAKIPLLKDWIEKKIEQRNAGKVENVNNSAGLVDGTIDTNLGVFRAYVRLYLDANPHISHSDDCFVTTLAQAATGVPLQIYCFTSTSKWFPYEAIQASVFEHVAVMLYQFKLYTFEYPTGRDTIIEGFVPGKHPDDIFGMPYHLYHPKNGQPQLDSAQSAQPTAPASSTNPPAQS